MAWAARGLSKPMIVERCLTLDAGVERARVWPRSCKLCQLARRRASPATPGSALRREAAEPASTPREASCDALAAVDDRLRLQCAPAVTISTWLVRANFDAASPIVHATKLLLSDTETARSKREATRYRSRPQGHLHWIGRSPPSSGKLRQGPAHEGNLRQMPASEGGDRQDTARHGVLRRRSIGRVQRVRPREPGGPTIVELGMPMLCDRRGQRYNLDLRCAGSSR
jgi:hypothetical protein